MAYCVVGYPIISQTDFDWIQNYRRENDRNFSLIKPHFTLVFPVDNVPLGEFVAEVTKQAAACRTFDFQIKVATTTFDRFHRYYHEFLVPDNGYSDIVKLHDRLYAGKLIPHRLWELDFIPHVGIGNHEEICESRRLVDALNEQGLDIKGSVDTLDIVEYFQGSGSPIETVERIQLI